MSLVTDLRSAVIQTQRQVRQQQSNIQSFLSANDKTMQEVNSALNGSAQGADQSFLSKIEQSKQSLKKSVQALSQADSALTKVSMI
jgi:uncharacterized protein YukE